LISRAESNITDLFDVVVRAFEESDAAAVAAILGSSPEAAAWSLDSIRRLGGEGLDAWVAETGVGVAGFLVGRMAADEFEILNLAISPAHRRKGIASKLLEKALEMSRGRGSRQAFLEVRASNAAAIGLYRRHGFTECGRRKSYYSDPSEDCLILKTA
jgi:ribosomal-protein-alanine N-acetyltransferase